MNAPTTIPTDERAFCGNCGNHYPSAAWPRTCSVCKHEAFKSPEPIAVHMTTVTDGDRIGLMIGKRGTAPKIGEWGLVGGFVENNGENFLQAADRERYEEVGMGPGIAGASYIFHHAATGAGQILVFCLPEQSIPVSWVHNQKLPDNDEIVELDVLWKARDLAFPLHNEVVRMFFADPKIGHRQPVFGAISSERVYQNMRWNADTTSTAGKHSVSEWILYMEDYLHDARSIVSRNSAPDASREALHTIRKIAAMGVACMEQHGAPPR